MRQFPAYYLKAAFLAAEEGEQVLLRSRTKDLGRLIDHDTERLFSTCLRLGAKPKKIQRLNCTGQHICLSGKPLERAIAEAQTLELNLVS